MTTSAPRLSALAIGKAPKYAFIDVTLDAGGNGASEGRWEGMVAGVRVAVEVRVVARVAVRVMVVARLGAMAPQGQMGAEYNFLAELNREFY